MGKLLLGELVQEVSLDLASGRSSDIILSQEDFEDTYAILCSLGILTRRQSLVLAYYFCGYSVSEIKDLLCCSYGYINKVLKCSFRKLVNYYRTHPIYFDWLDVYEDLTNKNLGGF